MSKTERQKYKIVGPATWELIRAAYLAGESATALAERYGVGVHGIRKRITVEKWTKRDFAKALEARGVKLPEKPTYDFIEEGVVRAAARASAEDRAEAERVADVQTWIEQIAAAEEADVMAGALERRALAQAGAAMMQGKSKEAQALAVLAEQMRKRAGVTASAAAQSQERQGVYPSDLPAEQERDLAADMFMKAAFLANAMLHAPHTAPARFLDMIIRWRQINLGEGEADAEASAARVMESSKRFFADDEVSSMPEEVREYLQRQWAATVAARTAGMVGSTAHPFSPCGEKVAAKPTDEGGCVG